MTTAVVGAGPVGTVLAQALAARGEAVLLLDPDPGPAPDGTWRRRGVMQFGHPHNYRFQVGQVLQELVPLTWAEVVAAGCVVNAPPDGVPPWARTLSARRCTFEAALRRGLRHSGVTFVPRRVDRVGVRGGRVTGVVAGGARYQADRVIVATGRAGRLGGQWRPEPEGGPCGQSYVSRLYRVRPGVEPPTAWNPLGGRHDGYVAMVLPHDAGTLSALVVRPTGDGGWAGLLRPAGFDAVAARVPVLAQWTDPARWEPLTDPVRGGTLVNGYRGQGTPPSGLFWVGDSVCTTNPSAGRGVALGLLQAAELLRLLQVHRDDRDASEAFDGWCTRHVRPWFDDHVAVDATASATDSAGSPDEPLTSDVVCAAAQADPSLREPVLLYLGMVTGPDALVPLQPRVRELLAAGWRPQPLPGPGRDELVAVLAGERRPPVRPRRPAAHGPGPAPRSR